MIKSNFDLNIDFEIESSDMLFEQLQENIIGIWLFRRPQETSKWCITFEVAGMYFDVEGYEDISDALKAAKENLEYVKKKKLFNMIEDFISKHLPAKRIPDKVKGLKDCLETVRENLVGLWKFRSVYSNNFWCATFIYNGCYYDTIGTTDPISTLVRIKFELNNLINK